jgi:UDPglucose 6-dehydrogenase
MKVTIIGTGYVGLVSGVCLAAKGHQVTCVDIQHDIVECLNAGKPHIYEAGLSELLTQVLESGTFEATTDLMTALDHVDTVIIAVGTPSNNGVIDLAHIRSAARSIGEYLKTHDRHISIIIKSTVIAGTTDTIVREEIEAISGKYHPAFGLGMNPEFLREGEAIEDFLNPDRIVIGYEDPETLERLEALYAPWDVDKVRVNTRTAELIKYANNALLATQISTANEIANLAAALGNIDVMDVINGVSLDRRWNPILNDGTRVDPAILSYLIPGCGFGGSCFPKDVQALHSQGKELGLPMLVMKAILDVNESQPFQVADIIASNMPNLTDCHILVLGLAFKPETDDVRESASIKIINSLLEKGANIFAHDPIAASKFSEAIGKCADNISFISNWQKAVVDSDVIILATKWAEYAELQDIDLSGKVFFDARRMLQHERLKCARYLSIGLQPIKN